MILELVSKAWKTSRVKFLLVMLPAAVMLVLAFFFKAWRVWLLVTAENILKKTQNEDKKLSEESSKIEKDADEHKKRADEIQKKVKEISSEEDPDWNKKI